MYTLLERNSTLGLHGVREFYRDPWKAVAAQQLSGQLGGPKDTVLVKLTVLDPLVMWIERDRGTELVMVDEECRDPAPKKIMIADLARQMGIKGVEVLKKLWAMGIPDVTINAAIDLETAQLLIAEGDNPLREANRRAHAHVEEILRAPRARVVKR